MNDAITREDLESKSDAELLEMQQSYWTIGAEDDEEWIARCAANFELQGVIDFILDCEADGGDDNCDEPVVVTAP